MRCRSLEGLVCILIAAAFVIPVGVVGGPPASKSGAEKQWTMLFYFCADNSLEWTTEFSVHIWETALTSNKDVNIVALVDIKSIDGIWIYELGGGTRKTVATWPEMDTSDPMVLEKFVTYGMKNYKAAKTMVMMSDHGYGWRGICNDETNRDTLMQIDGIAAALKNVKAATGKIVDILVFDACNMAAIEVAYELRDSVRYVVGTETTEPYDGPAYRMFISDVVANPAIPPVDLAKDMVHNYVLYYSSKWDYEHQVTYTQDFATCSAIDMSKMDALGAEFQNMATVLAPIIPEHIKEVENARGYALVGTWTNMAGSFWMPDVYTLAEGLRAIEGHPELVSAINSFETAFDAAILAEEHSKKYHDTVHGMNVWFPPSHSHLNSVSWSAGWSWYAQFIYVDSGLDLIEGMDSPWMQCLMAYFNAK